MKKKSIFAQIMTVVIVALLCIALTLGVALLFGSAEKDIFDLTAINWSNVVPILIIGGALSCVVVGIIVLFVSKDIFLKVRDYFFEKKKDEGDK